MTTARVLGTAAVAALAAFFVWYLWLPKPEEDRSASEGKVAPAQAQSTSLQDPQPVPASYTGENKGAEPAPGLQSPKRSLSPLVQAYSKALHTASAEELQNLIDQMLSTEDSVAALEDLLAALSQHTVAEGVQQDLLSYASNRLTERWTDTAFYQHGVDTLLSVEHPRAQQMLMVSLSSYTCIDVLVRKKQGTATLPDAQVDEFASVLEVVYESTDDGVVRADAIGKIAPYCSPERALALAEDAVAHESEFGNSEAYLGFELLQRVREFRLKDALNAGVEPDSEFDATITRKILAWIQGNELDLRSFEVGVQTLQAVDPTALLELDRAAHTQSRKDCLTQALRQAGLAQ